MTTPGFIRHDTPAELVESLRVENRALLQRVEQLGQSVRDALADTVAVERDNAELRVQLDEALLLAETRLERINELQRTEDQRT